MKNTLAILLFISFCGIVSGQKDNNLTKEITAIENGLVKNIIIKGSTVEKYNIQQRMEHYKVPGVSIAIVKDGQLRWAKGYGVANTENGLEVDANTLFQAGSISKPIAALSALKLYETGQLDLQEDVNQYLVDWKIPENNFTITEKVTVEKLLTHTAGTTVHGFPGYRQTDDFPEIIDVLSGKGNTDHVFVDTIPGSIWRYSGGGYTIMEKVVEDISGQALDEFMAEHILLPIGMTRSTYQQPIANEFQDNISAAYNGNGEIVEGLWNNYPEQAAAGLWTTPSDIALYCMEIQGILNNEKDGVLKKETVEMMLTKHKNDWGLGPSLKNEGERLRFQHGGKNEGFTNNMIASAHQGYAVIIMTNADNGRGLIEELQNSIAEFYNWPISNPRIIETISLSEAELQKYLGKYHLKQMGFTLELLLKEEKLFTQTPLGNLSLVPMTETSFIDIDNGVSVQFYFGEDETRMIVDDNFELVKLEE